MPRLAPQCLLKGVIPLPMGFRVKEPGNVVRFRALVRLLKLSPKDVSIVCGFSRSYVSWVLSRKDDFTGSPEFFRSLGGRPGSHLLSSFGRRKQPCRLPFCARK